MHDVLTRAFCFVAIILLGHGLRKIGFFKKEDFSLLSKIVIRITLTAAIVSSFSGKTIQPSMLLLTLMGLGFGIVLMAIAWLLNRPRGREQQAFAILNTAGCNIGTFVMPFAQGFLGPAGVVAVSLFDIGNSFICLGGSFGIASSVKTAAGKLSFKPVFRSLFRSVPFVTYLVMFFLSLAKITLPAPALELAGIIGNANAFMAMLMIGVGFDLAGDKGQLADVLRILAVRYGLGITLAVVSFCFLPFPLEHRQALVILFLSPIASAAPGFTAELKSDYGLASVVNSFSILISITAIVTALFFI